MEGPSLDVPEPADRGANDKRSILVCFLPVHHLLPSKQPYSTFSHRCCAGLWSPPRSVESVAHRHVP